jgi:U6 snRNA-associated Sm-like protein LSm1
MEQHSGNLPGATSLIEDLDSRVLVVLRDGKHVAGKLVSVDQFSNLVLEAACERVYAGQLMYEDPMGCMIVRSDNIVLVAQLDEDKEASGQSGVRLVDFATLIKERDRIEASGKAAPPSLTDPSLWNFEA